MKIKKLNFSLIEVMIGLSILSIGIIPLMSLPSRSVKMQLKAIRLMERERISEMAFLILQKEHLIGKTRDKIPDSIELEPITSTIPDFNETVYTPSFEIKEKYKNLLVCTLKFSSRDENKSVYYLKLDETPKT